MTDLTPQRTLIIGYGNPLRGDDAIGPTAAEHLQQSPLPPDVTVLSYHQLTPDLAETISQAAQVILIDAAVGDPPGVLTETRVHFDAGAVSPLHHYVTPETLLSITYGLYGCQPAMTLLTVNAETFAYGAALSPAVEAALPHVQARIAALITS
jgi:hydrogenase maturation protease